LRVGHHLTVDGLLAGGGEVHAAVLFVLEFPAAQVREARLVDGRKIAVGILAHELSQFLDIHVFSSSLDSMQSASASRGACMTVGLLSRARVSPRSRRP